MSVGHQLSASSISTWTEPPGAAEEAIANALFIIEVARQALIPRVTRLLLDFKRRKAGLPVFADFMRRMAGPPRQADHPPGSTSVNTEDTVPAESKFEDNEPHITRPTQPSSSKVWTQDPRDGEWTPTPPNAEYYQQDDVRTQEMERASGSAEHMRPPVRPGREASSSAGMFTNAHVKSISGGTFLNVAHIYEYDAPAQGGGPAFPIAVLGLHAVSFAMRSHYPHYSEPSIPLPLLMSESTTTSSLAIHLPLLYQDLRTVIGPLALWLLIKTWIQRKSLEYH